MLAVVIHHRSVMGDENQPAVGVSAALGAVAILETSMYFIVRQKLELFVRMKKSEQ